MRDSADSYEYGVTSRGKKRGKFYDDEPAYAKRDRHLPRLRAEDAYDAVDGLPEGDRWSTWGQSTPTERGPKPHPKWLVTDLAAVDHELGVLKTGKEADVFLVRRAVPGTSRSCLLAAKRYRDAAHRQFHRDAGYLEGRRVRESRVNRAVASRSEFGKQAIAGQWASAEFNALVQLYNARVPVPYPVQILGTEILLEFIGDADGTGAPRLAETRPGPAELASLWDQLVQAMATLAGAGFAHGDLSPYNLLVHRGRLVMIDLPQVVDVIANPNGRGFLDRDAKNVATWFARAATPARTPRRSPACWPRRPGSRKRPGTAVGQAWTMTVCAAGGGVAAWAATPPEAMNAAAKAAAAAIPPQTSTHRSACGAVAGGATAHGSACGATPQNAYLIRPRPPVARPGDGITRLRSRNCPSSSFAYRMPAPR